MKKSDMKDPTKGKPKSDLVDVNYRDPYRNVDRPAQTADVRKMPKGK